MSASVGFRGIAGVVSSSIWVLLLAACPREQPAPPRYHEDQLAPRYVEVVGDAKANVSLDAATDGPVEATRLDGDAPPPNATMTWKQLVHRRSADRWSEVSPPLSTTLHFSRVADLAEGAVADVLLRAFKPSLDWTLDPPELVAEVHRTGSTRYKAHVHGTSEFRSMNGNFNASFAVEGEVDVSEGEIRAVRMSGFCSFEDSFRSGSSGAWSVPRPFRRWAVAIKR